MEQSNKLQRITILSFLVTLLWVIAFLAIKISEPKELMAFLFSSTLFVLPGLIFGRMAFCASFKESPQGIILASAMSIASSCLITALIVFFSKWNIYFIILSLLFFSLFVYILLQKFGLSLTQLNSQYKWSYSDYIILLLFLIVLVLIIMGPYLNVGKMTKEGAAFTYLIQNDFVAHMNHTSALSQGIPPKYLHFSGEYLRYYWLSFILPAFTYNFNQKEFSIKNIMLLTQILYSLLFVSTLFCLFSSIIQDKKNLFLVMLLSLCAYSFNDLFVLYKIIINKFWPSWSSITIGGYRLLDKSSLSQGFYRFFIFEPQTLLAFCLLMLCLYLIYIYSNTNLPPWILILISLNSGLILGVETMTGMLAFGVVEFFLLIEVIKIIRRKRDIKKSMFIIVFSEIALFLIYKLFFTIGMFSVNQTGSSLIFKINTLILLTFPFYLLISFGPPCIFGVAGIISSTRNKEIFYHYIFLVLLTFSLVLMLFIDIADPKLSYLCISATKGGRTVLLSLLLFSSLFLTDIKRKHLNKIMIILIILAIPTLLIDIYILSNINNSEKTIYVNNSAIEASQWMKNNIPQGAIIQSFSDLSAYAIVTFGEKQMALGWKLAYRVLHDDVKNYPLRKKEIEKIFRTGDINEAINLIAKYKINYLYIGESDKKKLGDREYRKFYSHPNMFKRVYSKDGIDIFQINTNQHVDLS